MYIKDSPVFHTLSGLASFLNEGINSLINDWGIDKTVEVRGNYDDCCVDGNVVYFSIWGYSVTSASERSTFKIKTVILRNVCKVLGLKEFEDEVVDYLKNYYITKKALRLTKSWSLSTMV